MNISPKFLYDKEGKKVEVLLSYQDFMKLIEKIEDLEDIIAITDAQREGEKEGYLSEKEMLSKYEHLLPKQKKDAS